MTILRSEGPVISTRRSWRSAGVGATRQSAARTALRSPAENRGRRQLSIAGLPLFTRPQQFAAARIEATVESATKPAPLDSGSTRTLGRPDRVSLHAWNHTHIVHSMCANAAGPRLHRRFV